MKQRYISPKIDKLLIQTDYDFKRDMGRYKKRMESTKYS